jgi:hypothetical protein
VTAETAPTADKTVPAEAPVRVWCPEPEGAVCRFNLWGRCLHPRAEPDTCPLVVITLSRLPRQRPNA